MQQDDVRVFDEADNSSVSNQNEGEFILAPCGARFEVQCCRGGEAQRSLLRWVDNACFSAASLKHA